jgi:hypothetical protein
MTTRRAPRWYYGSDSTTSRVVFTLGWSLLLVQLLITKRLSHDHWWYWPLVVSAAAVAIWSIASTVWFIRDRRRAGGINPPPQ